MTTYTPAPIDTDDVELDNVSNELIEMLSKNVHEVWARGRINSGWQYGKKCDDVAKTHPCLVPYDSLPESEKVYDRNTAISTLRLIIKLGYKIEKKRI